MFEFHVDAVSGAARAGTLTLPHGEVQTPCFMPVGTQGTVRTLSPNDLRAAGASLVLANTYHLHVRPGEDVVGRLGGCTASWAGTGRCSPTPGGSRCSRWRARGRSATTASNSRATWTGRAAS